MNTTRKIVTTAAITAVLALGGVVGAQSLAAASYGGEPPTTEDAPDSDETRTPDDAQTFGVQAPDSESEPSDEREGRRGRGCRGDSEAVASALGLTTDELGEARESGQSLAAIADAQGVPVEQVIDAIVDAKEARLAEQVAEGELTQAEADERLADAEARATEKVTAEPRGSEDAPDGGAPDTTAPSTDAG